MPANRTVHARIPVGKNREIQVIEIPTEQGALIRIANHMRSPGTELSGVVFSVQYLDEVIEALRDLRKLYR